MAAFLENVRVWVLWQLPTGTRRRESLELPPRAPPLAPASAEPRAPSLHIDEAFDFDQTALYEEA